MPERGDQRERRRIARDLIARYHGEQLRLLLERVRQGFVQLDAGKIDPFELDDLIHQYKRSAQKPWSFCGQTISQWLTGARTLEYWREHGEPAPDWWAVSEPRYRR